MQNHLKEVMFEIWCPKCKHRSKLEVEEPCDECLDWPVNEDSTKPIKWEERE